jgi:hypothetical protein
LTIGPTLSVGIDTTNGLIIFTFASYPGSENISTTTKRIGRFRVQISPYNLESRPIIIWNFGGNFNTILTGENFSDITSFENHVSDISEFITLPIYNVIVSAITDTNSAPEKTIDGKGYNDGDLHSRWAAKPMPQWLIFDLGVEQLFSQTRFSFFKFNEGRIYQYSISVSNDLNNWTDILSNASSAEEEWTVNNFESTTARFVKLIFHSSTNNPDQWANLWEAEIWGLHQRTDADDNEIEEESVDEFRLSQNYPNPYFHILKLE